MLLACALRDLGAEVDLLLARVRLGAAPGVLRPRSHLLLRVREAGRTWHADVGFGMGTLLEPIPFGPGEAHEQAGWRFRCAGRARAGAAERHRGQVERPLRIPAGAGAAPAILQERFGLGGFALGADGRLLRRS